MTEVILTDSEISAIYAIDYVSDYSMDIDDEKIIAFPSSDDDWSPTDPASSALAA